MDGVTVALLVVFFQTITSSGINPEGQPDLDLNIAYSPSGHTSEN